MRYFTTDAFPSRARVTSWRDHVNLLYPTIDLVTAEYADFSGRVAWRDFGVTRVSRIESVAQRLVRTDRLARSDHERLLQLNFQLEGQGGLDQDGRSAVTRPGQFIMYDSARSYEMRFAGPFRQLSLELPRSAIESDVEDLAALMACPIDGNCGAGRYLFEFVRSLASDEDPVNLTLALRLQQHACELLVTALTSLNSSAAPRKRGRRRALERVQCYLRERLDEPDLTPVAIAAAQHISLRHLHSIFRAINSTPVKWIQAERLERCRSDLTDPVQGHRSICEIAHRWGFRDAAHFSRVFKRRFGYSPRTCRSLDP